MATLIDVLAVKIVRPETALEQTALLNLEYTGAHRDTLNFVALPSDDTTFTAPIPGIVLTADKVLSRHDSNYRGGNGLRVWLSVDPTLFHSLDSTKFVTFSVWQQGDGASAPSKLSPEFTLIDTVDIIRVQDNQNNILTPETDGAYKLLYYPVFDQAEQAGLEAPMPSPNCVRVANLLLSGGRVAGDEAYSVYLFENDDSELLQGAFYRSTVDPEDDCRTIVSIYYDLSVGPLQATRDLSLTNDVIVTASDKYRSVNVTLRLVPIADPTNSLTFTTPITTYEGNDVYSLTDAEYETGDFVIATSTADRLYTSNETFRAIDSSLKLAANISEVISASETHLHTLVIDGVKAEERNRLFALAFSSKTFYLVRDLKVDTFVATATIPLGNTFVPSFTFLTPTLYGKGAFTATLTATLDTGYTLSPADYSERDDSASITFVPLTGIINGDSYTFSISSVSLSEPLAALKTKYARFKFSLTVTNGTKSVTVTGDTNEGGADAALLLHSPLYTIPQAIHAYHSEIPTTITNIYVPTRLIYYDNVINVALLYRGGFNYNGSGYTYSLDVNPRGNFEPSLPQPGYLRVSGGVSGGKINHRIDLQVSDGRQSFTQSYDMHWFEAFQAYLRQSTLIVYQQEESATNSSGVVYRYPHGDDSTVSLFKITAEDNPPFLDGIDTVVATLERRVLSEESWSTWSDDNVTVTFVPEVSGFHKRGHVEITLSNSIKFRSSDYEYRLKMVAHEMVYLPNSIIATGDVALPVPRDPITLYQTIIVEDVSYTLKSNNVWDPSKYLLNYNPYPSAGLYSDLSPATPFNNGLINIAKDGAIPVQLPAYQVIAHGTTPSGLIAVKLSGVEVTAANADDRFCIGIVPTVGSEMLGAASTIPSATYDTLHTLVSVGDNVPNLFASGLNLGTFVYVDGSLRITSAQNTSINFSEVALYLSDITALATPSRPQVENTTHALVFVHGLLRDGTIRTVSSYAIRFTVLTSDIITNVKLYPHGDRSLQFLDCFRMNVDLRFTPGGAEDNEDRLFTYTLSARTIGTSLNVITHPDRDTQYSWNGAPGEYFQLASNVGGDGVSLTQLKELLKNRTSSGYGWPERALSALTINKQGLDTTTFNRYTDPGPSGAGRWLEYKLEVQSMAVYIPSAADASYGLVSSNILRIHDWSADYPNSFDRRNHLTNLPTTRVDYKDNDTHPNVYYALVLYDNRVLDPRIFTAEFAETSAVQYWTSGETTTPYNMYLLSFGAPPV